jgi:hypothetical protein
MELLIPGLILVALMIYASTRIKRTAAAAFDAETVEGENFTVEKPDGFLNVIGGEYPFEAYSKDFGAGGEQDVRLGRALLTIMDGSCVLPDERSKERTEVIDDIHYTIFEIAREENGVQFIDQHKTADHAGQCYEFRTIRLASASEEFSAKLEALLDSFRLR